MALRRSTRLSALLPLQPTAQAATSASQRSNGITKARRPSTKEKRKRAQIVENLNSHAQFITDPDPTEQNPRTTAPPLPPSAVKSNAHSSNYWESKPTSNPRSQTPPPLDRPVEPHRTNATLLTPHGSSLVAYPPGITGSDISPSKPGLPRPTATTGTLLEKATAHLIATDPRLEPLIKAHPCALFSPEGLAEKIDPFRSLVGTIIGQQVSGAAARSIREKFVALLWRLKYSCDGDGVQRWEEGEEGENEGYFPTPEEIVRADIPTLRTAGLSQRKAEYIHGLAEKFANGELSARMLLNASDEELLEKLTAVRGLGRWSVEMFACFTLKRTDVFSTGDLGVQRGCAAFLGKDISKLKAKGGKFKYMSEKEMLELAAKFAPYRSLFMWYMWRVEEVDVTVMTG
ncbi:hypothetical protein BDW71DRAFT_173563 [Aspergillus fruticulosus]